ncbi:hypothetical protein [Paludibacterium denitrificans]|uniref:Uncharacterized protein n=1 Tax=Paludibacterium denitrificans TaxID=2675226 RepID=A0A844GD63_9NEIS|nr:hypothetical protein [Paludibacterium denitrificans]MTD33599.1 hypothetical protein [Paludibacterium denitrificans]
MLRLVGGTAFKGADGAESTKTEVVEAMPTTKKKSVKVATPVTLSPAQKDAARKLILDCVVRQSDSGPEMSVQGWIDAANRDIETGESVTSGSPAFFVLASIIFDRMGIVLSSGGKEFGMQSHVYATVVEPKKLVRYIPQLKKGAADLLGLPLY